MSNTLTHTVGGTKVLRKKWRLDPPLTQPRYGLLSEILHLCMR